MSAAPTAAAAAANTVRTPPWPSISSSSGGPRLLFAGHRGVGKNKAPDGGLGLDAPPAAAAAAAAAAPVNPDIRENTVLSMNQAAELGVDFVEFDVQVTKDGHPVIFHDNHILTEDGLDCKISDLTLKEFKRIGPPREQGQEGRKLLRRRKDGSTYPWRATEESPLPSLFDLFDSVDPRLGFNIEVKFAADDPRDAGGEAEIDRMLNAILPVVSSRCGPRPLFFSSFMPDAVTAIQRRQARHQVFFLTVGSGNFSDDRMNSVAAAVSHCQQHGLSGVVSEVSVLLSDASLIRSVKDADLLLLSYGSLNDDLDAARFQQYHGVDGIIVDNVAGMARPLLDVTSGDLTPPFGKYG